MKQYNELIVKKIIIDIVFNMKVFTCNEMCTYEWTDRGYWYNNLDCVWKYSHGE